MDLYISCHRVLRPDSQLGCPWHLSAAGYLCDRDGSWWQICNTLHQGCRTHLVFWNMEEDRFPHTSAKIAPWGDGFNLPGQARPMPSHSYTRMRGWNCSNPFPDIHLRPSGHKQTPVPASFQTGSAHGRVTILLRHPEAKLGICSAEEEVVSASVSKCLTHCLTQIKD